MTYPLVALGKCCRVISGATPKREVARYWSGDILWVTPKDLSKLNSTYLYETPEKITHAGHKSCSAEMLPIGSLLFSSRAPIGHIAIVGTPMCTNQGFKSLIPSEQVDSLYLFYCLKWLKPRIEAMGNGATFKEVSKKIVEKVEIPLPSLKIQKQIAVILEKADNLRKQSQQVEQQLNALAQSVFLEMFGDPVTNPMGWIKKPMEQVMTIKRGGSPRPIEEFVGGDIPWIKIGDATKGDDIYISRTKEKIIHEGLKKTVYLEPGSLIFANCGVSLGFARILKIAGCIHDGWLSFSNIDEVLLNKIFILKTLNTITEHFRSIAPAGTQPNLNTGIMKSFELIIPPLELQNRFANILVSITKQKVNVIKSYEENESLYNSLIQKSFNGELNLKSTQASSKTEMQER